MRYKFECKPTAKCAGYLNDLYSLTTDNVIVPATKSVNDEQISILQGLLTDNVGLYIFFLKRPSVRIYL